MFSDSWWTVQCLQICAHVFIDRPQNCAPILFRSLAGLCVNFGRSRVKVCPARFGRSRSKLFLKFARSRARLCPNYFAPCPFPNLAGTRFAAGAFWPSSVHLHQLLKADADEGDGVFLRYLHGVLERAEQLHGQLVYVHDVTEDHLQVLNTDGQLSTSAHLGYSVMVMHTILYNNPRINFSWHVSDVTAFVRYVSFVTFRSLRQCAIAAIYTP